MAANYKVNIQLDTKTLDKQLKDLGVKIDKVGKVKQGQSKKTLDAGDKEVKQELQKIRLTNERLGIETQVKKIKSQIIDNGKVINNLEESALKTSTGELDLAKKGNLLAKQAILETKKELAFEKKVTAEKAKQVNLQSAGMNLIRLSGKAGKLGGRTAAVIDQQTALRQPKGLPSASMLNAEARGIKRLIPERLTDVGRIVSRDDTGGIRFTATSAKKAAAFEERINKARKRGIENNKKLIGSEVLRNKQTIQGIKATEQAATAEARRLDRALRTPMGPSSRLNFRGGQLLPGPAGSGRGGGLTSALISGAFPLLFGQGPFAAAGGFTGGLIGDKLGGQMGGFAGGLLGTATVTAIQGFTVQVGTLGAALNENTKDVTALSGALGITGTEFEKQLQTLQKLGGEEAAFEAARQRMINLVGQQGVDALTKFGDEFTELGNNFAKIMTLMKSSFAKFLQESGVGKFISRTVDRSVLLRQADQSENKRVQDLVAQKQLFTSRTATRQQRKDIAASVGFTGRFDDVAGQSQILQLLNERIAKEQRLVNEKNNQLEVEKNLKKIQGTRMDDINEEIALLERTFNMSSEEFEIEKQIMEMNKESKILDEEAVRTGLKRIQDLEKQRDLARETAEAFKQMQQTIATDIADGIQGMIRGTSTLNDVLSNVLNKLIDASFNMAFFGNMQGSLGGGGLFGSILGGLFSGSKNKNSGILSSPVNPFFFMADGGPVKRGGSFIVGERGPELFTPGVSGMITPNHALGGSTTVVVNVDASGSSVEGDEQQGRELGRVISAAVQSEILNQKRPGGLLA